MTDTKLDSFTRAYIECALWSSTTDYDTPMDRDYGIDDIAPETLAHIVADCERFQKEQTELIYNQNLMNTPRGDGFSAIDQAGHDFWLTRNGHGAGFWDGDWTEPAATKLTDAAETFGTCDLYVGNDSLLYII